jgi:hypothetical protein
LTVGQCQFHASTVLCDDLLAFLYFVANFQGAAIAAGID